MGAPFGQGAAGTEPARGRALKANPRRSVFWLEVQQGPVVVKRFHHPGRIGRLVDGRRARAEYSRLEELRARGLPVPRPLDCRATPAGWELHLEAIPGAIGLDELLDRPGGGAEHAAQVGDLLARSARAGLAHADLHPGNVLLDATGRAWLVDVRAARLSRELGARAATEELVRLAAPLREAWPSSAFATLVGAWRGALAPALARAVPDERTLAELARVRRIEVVERGIGRWLRESSRTRVERVWRRSFLVRRDLGPIPVERAAEERAGALLVSGMPARELVRHWKVAARLTEQRIPAWLPRILARGRDGWASFEIGALDPAELTRRLADRGLVLDRMAADAPPARLSSG
jgi:hypothetical protein